MLTAMSQQFLSRQLSLGNNHRLDHLAAEGAGDSQDHHFLHALVLNQDALDFRRIDLVSARVDKKWFSTGDGQSSAFVEASDVAREKIAPMKRNLRRNRIAIV